MQLSFGDRCMGVQHPSALWRSSVFIPTTVNLDICLLLKAPWVSLTSRKRTFIHYESSQADIIRKPPEWTITPKWTCSLYRCNQETIDNSWTWLIFFLGNSVPTKEYLCTRFATELVLRRDPTTNTTVTIIPGAERSDDEKEKLLGFKTPTLFIDGFPSLIDNAKKSHGPRVKRQSIQQWRPEGRDVGASIGFNVYS